MPNEDALIRAMLEGSKSPAQPPVVLSSPANDMQIIGITAGLIFANALGTPSEMTEKEAIHCASRLFAMNMVLFQQGLVNSYIKTYMEEMSVPNADVL